MPITWASSGSTISGLGWTLTYSTADFSGVTFTLGPAAVEAGKELSCYSPSAGQYNCVLTGLNSTDIASGVVANAVLSASSTVAVSPVQVGVTQVGASSPVGDNVTAAGYGASIDVLLPLKLSSLVCSPASLASGGSSICTVTLNTAAEAEGVVVSLGFASSQSVPVTMPSSVTVPAGAASATFPLQVGTVTTSASISLTASISGSTATTSVAVTTPVAVSMTPTTVTLGSGQTQQFAVTVAGAADTRVTWTVSPASGTIANGLYTAPASIASAQTVWVRATSVADPSKNATAAVYLVPVVVSITPAAATLSASQSHQFNASVTGSANKSVSWSLSPAVGSITNGLYTAPASITSAQTVSVRATSAADTSRYAVATVSLTPPLDTTAPVISAQTSTPSSSSAQIGWTASEPSTCKVIYGVSASSLTQSVSDSSLVTSARMTLNGLSADTTYYYRIVATDAAGNAATWPAVASAPASFRTTVLTTPPPPSSTPSSTLSMWTTSHSATKIEDPDTAAVELGLKFSSDVGGKVIGLRFLKGSSNNGGTHTGSLWNASGQRLATVTFTNETSTGWQTAYFATAVPIVAKTTYVISYHAPQGRYSVTNGGLNAASHSGPLHVPASGGVYRYGASSFPNQTYDGSNYWVDVLMQPDENLASPASALVVTGSLKSGTAVSLTSDDGKLFQVTSTTAAPFTAGWSAAVTGVSKAAGKVSLTFSGKTSRSCTETLSAWNFRTNSWTVLETRTAGTSEVMRTLAIPGTVADYIADGTGEVRISGGCTTGSGSLTLSLDLVRIAYK